jgi:hypothetical protein
MNKSIRRLFWGMALVLSLTGTAHATHDSGQGKSQDGALESISVAPEPSTFWLFLIGGLALATFGQYQRKDRG